MLIALLIILAYVLGSIPSGLVVGKLAKGIDIREHGSGNLGATNAFRTLGVKAGSVVVAADILKGTLAAAVAVLTARSHSSSSRRGGGSDRPCIPRVREIQGRKSRSHIGRRPAVLCSAVICNDGCSVFRIFIPYEICFSVFNVNRDLYDYLLSVCKRSLFINRSDAPDGVCYLQTQGKHQTDYKQNRTEDQMVLMKLHF